MLDNRSGRSSKPKKLGCSSQLIRFNCEFFSLLFLSCKYSEIEREKERDMRGGGGGLWVLLESEREIEKEGRREL